MGATGEWKWDGSYWHFKGASRAARYYAMSSPYSGYTLELWGPESGIEFGPVDRELQSKEVDVRSVGEQWVSGEETAEKSA